MPAFWRDADRSPVTVQEAVGEWALSAWDVLEAVAARWGRTVEAADLAAEVQRRSGIVTSTPSSSWIGPVLSLVAQRAQESRGPVLTSLVTDGGRAYAGFRDVLAAQGTPALGADDLAERAADAREATHRAYGAKEPARRASGGARTARAAKAAKPTRTEPPKPRVCPTCFLELPATGVCDNCD